MQEFTDIYIGKVVDNKDPKKIGRLKINVPNIHGNIKKDDLPWANPCFPYGVDNKGIVFVPEKDTLCAVMFINGSIYAPIWLGVIYREKEDVPPDEIMEELS